MEIVCKWLNFKSGALATRSITLENKFVNVFDRLICNNTAKVLNDCSTFNKKYLSIQIN